jgi:hypothetical protein
MRGTQETIMKTIVFTALLAFILAGAAGCANNSSGPYGDPGLDVASAPGLHPISGTNEGVELFKDDDSD